MGVGMCLYAQLVQHCKRKIHSASGVGTYLSGTARAVPLFKVGRLVMHFAVPLFGHRLHIALIYNLFRIKCSQDNFDDDMMMMMTMIDVSFILLLRKLIKMDATRCLNMHQIQNLDPTGGAYSAPPEPLAGLRGAASRQGRRGEGRGGARC